MSARSAGQAGVVLRRAGPRWFIMQKVLGGLAVIAVLMLARPALALDPGYTLAQYQHTAWTEREGAPANVRGIAESPDGDLLIASPMGLTRFDGFDFAPVTELGGESLGQETITDLFNGPDRSILLNFGGGRGAAVYAAGRLVRLPACTLGRGAVRVNGTLWLVCNKQIMQLSGERLEHLEKGWNYSGAMTENLVVDARGTIWAAGDRAWLALDQGARRFRRFARNGSEAAVSAPDGSLWSLDADGMARTQILNGAPMEVGRVSRRQAMRMLVDRDGGLWIGGIGGLYHQSCAHPSKPPAIKSLRGPDTMTRLDGLASDVVTALFEDQRGAVWVGTSAGIERFRDNLVLPLRMPGLLAPPSIAPDDEAGVWATNHSSHLFKVSATSFEEVGGSDAAGIACLSRVHDGTVWGVNGRGILLGIRDGRITRVPTAPAGEHGATIAQIPSIAEATLCTSSAGSEPDNSATGHWMSTLDAAGLADRWRARVMLVDQQGRVWASRRGDMMRLTGARAARFSVAQGLQVGEIFAAYQRGERLWVGGRDGIAYFDGSSFHTLRSAQPHAFASVGGILETAEGDLWLHEYDAAVRIRASELETQRRVVDYPVRSESFDSLDGLYGRSPPAAAGTNLVQASDGRIWLATSEGLMTIDPERTRPVAYVPPVRVREILVDGVPRNPEAALVLTRRTKSVRFVYSAVSPASAERVRFRYRLEGLDSEWTEAGTRRAITYNTLPPGYYRFHVEATDDEGGWVANESVLDFRVEEAWFQALVFRLAYGGAALFAIWSVYRWHLAWMTGKIRWRLKVRQAERERIARDLHDILLQGVQGLIWRLQGVANLIPPADPVRGKLENALNATEELLVDSRRRVLSVREEGGAPFPLSAALEDVIASVVGELPAVFSFETDGEEMPVKDHVQVDVCAIVREAFANAVVHGRATLVDVRVAYSRRALTVLVRDDGCGIDPKIASSGRPGHWGLAGMRERARELGGAITIQPGRAGGTEILFTLRASKAFDRGAVARRSV